MLIDWLTTAYSGTWPAADRRSRPAACQFLIRNTFVLVLETWKSAKQVGIKLNLHQALPSLRH